MNPSVVRIGLALSLLWMAAGFSRAAEEPLEVPVVRVVAQEVTDHEDFTGRAQASTQVELRPRVSGYLERVLVDVGDEVKQGAGLFEIDSRPYQADLKKAEAARTLAEAQLRKAEADWKRFKELLARAAVSREEYDRAEAERVVVRAQLEAAKATCEAAQLYVDFCRVTAPVSGKFVRRVIDAGNFVKADETVLGTLHHADPIHVVFDVDERTLLRLRRLELEGKQKTKNVPVQVGLNDETGFPHRGVVSFTDLTIDPQSGTARLRAVLANKEKLLIPGMFVRVRLPIGQPYRVLLVPTEAVMPAPWQGEEFVYRVSDKGRIEKATVMLGARRDAGRIILSGLGEGDRVVVGRQHKLHDGMIVRPVEKKPESRSDPSQERPAPPARPRKETAAEPPPAAPDRERPAFWAWKREKAGAVLLVEAAYPGANAKVVADTVAAPIEQQVRGMENVLFMQSRSTSDGKYTLAVTLERGADPDISQVLLQNRVTLATPVLPEVVKVKGIRVRKEGPGMLGILGLFSPDKRFDSLYLSRYAELHLKDELARLPGVADVGLLGQHDLSLRIWIDPERTAARGLSISDVVQAVRQLEPQVANQPIGAPPSRDEKPGSSLTVSGRKTTIEDLEKIVIKTSDDRSVVYLRDLARVEWGGGTPESQVSWDGRPAVALVLRPLPQAKRDKLRPLLRGKLAALRSRFPAGIDIDTSLDLHDPALRSQLIVVDVELPAAASPERVFRTLRRAEELLRQQRGVKHTMALSQSPFDRLRGGPCILVRLESAPKQPAQRAEVMDAIRRRLDEIKEMSVRIRGVDGYRLALVLHGPEPEPVRQWATKLAEQLERSKKLTDVGMNRDSTPIPQLHLDVDRNKARDLGVPMDDIFNVLQVYLGSYYVNDFNRFGRTWQVVIQAPPKGGKEKDLRQLQVRNRQGQMVPLGTLIQVKDVNGPQAIDFFNGRPMMEITANPAPGASASSLRELCEKLAEQTSRQIGLSREYQMSWTQEPTVEP